MMPWGHEGYVLSQGTCSTWIPMAMMAVKRTK